MESGNLTVLRNEVLDALRNSITDFTAEAELEPAPRQDANTVSRMNWIVENGRKALRDLTTFFTITNFHLYSGEPTANYIWISCIFKDGDSVNTRYSQIGNLEEFWLAKDIILWDNRPENIFCMFAKSDHISPRAEGFKRARFLDRKLPLPEAICRSAIVALIFLLKSHLHLTAPDMHYLMAESLGHNEFCSRPQLLCDLSEEDLCLDVDSDTPWHSITSAAVLPIAFSRCSTKVLTFPGKLPEYQTAYNYMDIYQPHGSQPAAKSSCAIWGAWKDQRTWRSVVSFSNLRVAELYRKCLHRGNTSPRELSLLLSSHWIYLLRGVYRLSINDGRLILRNAAKDIEEIKYSNSAKPSIGSANVCLMYLNHFDYFNRIAKALCEDVKSYPPQWQYPALGEMAPSDWIQEVGHECETLHKEVLVVTMEADKVRKLILEQHNLFATRKTNLLTVLASIFIPMSFVASVFGMNTREINGSVWQLKYYFIAAIPLAVLTILLPLIILPVFNFILRHLATHTVLQAFLYWSLVITSLVANIFLDITGLSRGSFFMFISVIPASLLGIKILYGVSSMVKKQRLEAASCYLLSVFIYPFVELPPYFIYFVFVWYRHQKEKKSKGNES